MEVEEVSGYDYGSTDHIAKILISTWCSDNRLELDEAVRSMLLAFGKFVLENHAAVTAQQVEVGRLLDREGEE